MTEDEDDEVARIVEQSYAGRLSLAATKPPPPKLKPMSSFPAGAPALLHNALTGQLETWTGEQGDDFTSAAVSHADGRVEWNGRIFDGWTEVLGG